VRGGRQLAEIRKTLDGLGLLVSCGDGRQQQTDEDGDDADHHQQLDEREG
jgi:hypothetical protein